MPARPRALRGLALAAALLGLLPGSAAAEPVPAARAPVEEALDGGMTLAAKSAFLALPPAARGRSATLPRLLRALADAGRADEALRLLDESKPVLAEPVRSGAFLAAGTILWERRDFEGAARALREVAAASPEAADAAILRARILAARGDPAGALRLLDAVPPGGRRSLNEGWIHAARGDDAAALAAWSGASAGGPAGFEARALAIARRPGPVAATGPDPTGLDNAAAGFAGRNAARGVLASRLLAGGDRIRALATAREALADLGRWKDAVSRLPAWDATPAGADAALDGVTALFPHAEDAREFAAAARRFRLEAALLESVRRADNGVRELSRRSRAAASELDGRRAEVDARIRRAERILETLTADKRRAAGMRTRLSDAASALSVPALGERLDPGIAALLRRIDATADALRKRLAAARAASDAAARDPRTGALSTDDRRMLFFSGNRLARVDDALAGLEGRASLARGRAWNRWKAAYAARLSSLLDAADGAAAIAAREAARAGAALASMRSLSDDLAAWRDAMERTSRLLARDGDRVAALRSAARAGAERSLSIARSELAAAVGRRGRALSYIAARAATEWRIAGSAAAAGDNGALSPERKDALRAEATRHWEAALAGAGEADPYADEALYALAEFRAEEAEARRGAPKEPPAGFSGYAEPIALYGRILKEFPRSPYAEAALYGLAVCFEAVDAKDNAASALSALLDRNPGTRYADEIALRLGEYAFERDDFREAEGHYRRVRAGASPEIRATALYKLGWSLFLQDRFGEAVDPFLSSVQASPAAGRTGGVAPEGLAMAARSLVEAGLDRTAEDLLARRAASAHGPALLLKIQEILDAQNRYAESVAVADRVGSGFPLCAERIDSELAAARSLRKAGLEEEDHARRGAFARAFGPGSAWQAAPGRAPGEIARANLVAEEELRTAAFYFHAGSRKDARADRGRVLALYDDYLARFPASPKTGEVAYQRAWLLFEAGRKKEAKSAFEAIAPSTDGARGEAAAYMAVQCAKDLAAPDDAATQEEIVRLSRDYERLHPKGDRIGLILHDRARAHFRIRAFPASAEAAARAAALLPAGPDRRAAERLAADGRFEGGDYAGAETAYRALRSGAAPPEAGELETWIGYAMFRRAERAPKERAADAGDLFLRLAEEFPALDIAPTARFRAGVSYAEAGRPGNAIAAFLPLERIGAPGLARDATSWLARLYETNGQPLDAAERFERLASTEPAEDAMARLLLRAADLYERGRDGARFRSALRAAAAAPGTVPVERIRSWYRAAESARADGLEAEADGLYAEAGKAAALAPEAAPELAGRAAFRRAEFRFRDYLPMAIGAPMERTFPAKQAALEACASLYLEAIRLGDADTVTASLHRLGEGFENFRSAILASPVPPDLAGPEKEEYVFLLEDKAAPIEDKAIEAYLKSVRHAVAGGVPSPWAERSLGRLKALRPARFARRWEYAFPVLAVPDLVGIIERSPP